MMSSRHLLYVFIFFLLCVHFVTCKPKSKKRAKPEDGEDPNMEALEETAKCGICEKLIELIEKKMKLGNTAAPLNLPKKTAKSKELASEVWAMDVLDGICNDKEIAQGGAPMKFTCESVVEENEEDIVAYIRKGRVRDTFKETICESRCGWKSSLKMQIQNMKNSMKPGMIDVVKYTLLQQWKTLLALCLLVFVITAAVTIRVQMKWLEMDSRRELPRHKSQ
jgi:hypothetical protein